VPVIQVEFFGVPRLKAGVVSTQVTADNIAELFTVLREQLPEFADACLNGDRLAAEYLLSINGIQFTRDETITLHEGDQVLILSADVGG
jgi:molybdopterin converting factor small subunit